MWRDSFKFREKRVMGAPFLLTWFRKVQQFSIFFPTVLRCLSDLKVTVINQYVIEHTFIWSAFVYFSTLTYTKRTFLHLWERYTTTNCTLFYVPEFENISLRGQQKNLDASCSSRLLHFFHCFYYIYYKMYSENRNINHKFRKVDHYYIIRFLLPLTILACKSRVKPIWFFFYFRVTPLSFFTTNITLHKHNKSKL